MGCWNGTCGVSQIPILSGMKVKAYLILQSPYAEAIGGAGVCYTTAHFRPWFLPVNAEYNDYGSVENIEMDWNASYMLSKFQQWLKKGDVRILENDECEINSPDIEKFTKLEDVFDCVERGALVFKHGKKELRVGMLLVLDGIFTAMVNEATRYISSKSCYWEKHDKEERKKFHASAVKVRETASKEKSKDTELYELLYEMQLDLRLGGLIEENLAFKHYKEEIANPKGVDIDTLCDALEKNARFCLTMDVLRKLWIPQTGQGSQTEILSFNKVLGEAMIEHVKKRGENDGPF